MTKSMVHVALFVVLLIGCGTPNCSDDYIRDSTQLRIVAADYDFTKPLNARENHPASSKLVAACRSFNALYTGEKCIAQGHVEDIEGTADHLIQTYCIGLIH